MLFSSLEFLFLFVPVTLIAYYVTPPRWRNGVLLVLSLIFYGWGEPMYVALMAAVIAADYLFGLAVGKNRERPAGKRWLLAAVAVNLAVLGFFKYAGWLLGLVRHIPGLSDVPTPMPSLSLSLPIGISFYTFQALSYVIDVYRGDADAQSDPVRFGTYVTLFPQLIAGPIVRYHDIETQLDTDFRKNRSVAETAAGVRTFLAGLGKKVLLANTAGELWVAIRDIPPTERSVTACWLGLALFSLQIYFDFSGYSDMAIGLGRLFGFTFGENFYYPYTATSVTDFWRRWHISLSTWFREYVYIPLGGNRCGRGRMVCNLLVTWLLTGLWHGARGNYLLWGLYYFILLTTEKLFLQKWLKKAPVWLTRVYALFFIMVGWLIFAFEDSSEGLIYLSGLLGLTSGGFIRGGDIYELARNAFFLLIAGYACTPHARKLYYRCLEQRPRLWGLLTLFGSTALFCLCVASLIRSGYNPFLYFRF